MGGFGGKKEMMQLYYKLKKKTKTKELTFESPGSGKMVHTFNHSTYQAETMRSLCAQSHPNLHDVFQASNGYTGRPCLL